MARMKKPKTKQDQLIDELLAGVDPSELLGPDGLLRQLQKRAVETALEAELSDHLGYEKHDPAGRGSGNSRNGTTPKTVLTDTGTLDLDVPRDREGSFEPKLVPKHVRRLPGFDDKVVALYARGLSTRGIREHLEELYEVEVSPTLISRVTDGVLADVHEWQSRPLSPVWPIVYLDALVVRIKEAGTVERKSVYMALGVNMEGKKEVLGLWVAGSEGAKFWMHVLTELKHRGVQDVLIAVCDGLTGFPRAIETVFPRTTVQTCIVHMVRNSLRFVSWKNRKPVARELRAIYTAASEDQAGAALTRFEEGEWGQKYPTIGASWRTRWDQVVPFLAFGPDIRRAVYTTNAIESLNRQLRKTLKTRGHFPTDQSAVKLLWLALERASRKWTYPIKEWDMALQQLAIHFPGRLPL